MTRSFSTLQVLLFCFLVVTVTNAISRSKLEYQHSELHDQSQVDQRNSNARDSSSGEEYDEQQFLEAYDEQQLPEAYDEQQFPEAYDEEQLPEANAEDERKTEEAANEVVANYSSDEFPQMQGITSGDRAEDKQSVSDDHEDMRELAFAQEGAAVGDEESLGKAVSIEAFVQSLGEVANDKIRARFVQFLGDSDGHDSGDGVKKEESTDLTSAHKDSRQQSKHLRYPAAL